jgi:hypothetical protein
MSSPDQDKPCQEHIIKGMRTVFLMASLTLVLACSLFQQTSTPPPSRQSAIPPSAVKMSPATDEHPPQLHSSDYENPVPLPASINTAGAEDSPFITPDGKTLYFFFTPDPNLPPEKQVIDGVTGLYVSSKDGDQWTEPQRLILQEPGKLALDGCEFILGDLMYFCTVREGLTGVHWFTAHRIDGLWQDWKIADFNPAYDVGELHINASGDELYFHADRPGGQGGLDIWLSRKVDGEWQTPVNLSAVNSPSSEGWPALSPDGNELWFTRDFGVWRSRRVSGDWGAPELIVSSLAGEPSLDQFGNLYFVHHFYSGEKLIEADIYLARKKH